MDFVAQVFIWLMFYSFVGWFYESTLCSVTGKKLVNRGFLNGPICPIYGFGALTIIFCIGQTENSLVSIFLSSAVLACTLEYFTSWAMEKLFHARWWDYGYMRFQLNGRICLGGFLLFGVFGVIILYWIHPWLQQKVLGFSQPMLYTLTGGCLALSASDAFATVRHVLRLDQRLAEVQQEMETFLVEAHERGEQWALETGAAFEQLRQGNEQQRIERRRQLHERFEKSAVARNERLKALIERRRFQDVRLNRAFPNLRHNRIEAWEELKERLKQRTKSDDHKGE